MSLCPSGDVHPAGKPLIPVIYDHKADKYIGESTDIIKYIEVPNLPPQFHPCQLAAPTDLDQCPTRELCSRATCACPFSF